MTGHPYTRFFILPSAPTVDEDETEGYEAGDVVLYDGKFYDCSDPTAGAAVWVERTGGVGSVDWGDIGGDLADQADLIAEFSALNSILESHTDNVSNPHNVTAAQVGAPAHTLSTAINDFLVGSGSNTWIKKTLAETITILRTSLDSIFAPIAKGVTNGDSHDHTGGDGATLRSKMFVFTYLSAATVPASTTYHTAPGKGILDANSNNIPFPYDGVLNNLIVRIASAQPASGSLVVTMTIANVDTALVVTIPAGSAAGSYTFSTNVSISGGNLIKWKVVNNATAASAQFTAITMGYEIAVAP